MKKLFLISLVLTQAVLGCTQSLNEKLDEYLNANARLGKFNGVALVAKDGKILLNKGYGWRDAHKRTAHNEQSIFQLGSITKQFTATIILYLQERGKLNVQDKLSKYIPGYPEGERITIEHLLTHSSGIFNYTNDNRFMNTQTAKPIELEKLIEVFRDKPLNFEPGSKYSYSNSGYILLGYIIRKVSGKSYEQMVRDVIFKPLQMQKSGFDFIALKDPARTTGYFVLDADTVKATIVDFSVSFAAGSIYSTTGDLYKWHKALYTEKIIKQSSLEKAFKPYKNKYGYGWIIDTVDNRRIIVHGGGIFGFTSDMLRSPADDVCIILLSNTPADLTPLTKNLYKVLYNQPYDIPKAREVLKLPENVLQQYVGEYEFTPD